MSLKIYNISKKSFEEENVPAEKSLRFLYGGSCGKVALEVLVARAAFSKLCGLWADSKISRGAIAKFIAANSINTDEMLLPPEKFATFNEFFTRALKPDARPVGDPENPRAVSFPADGRHLLVRNISKATQFYAKGQKFDLARFLGDEKLAKRFEGGDMLISRLSPLDYHRFHYPISGEIVARRKIKGKLYSVSPIALAKNLSIFWENRRVLNLLESDIGLCAYVEIGATNVGSIINFDKVGTKVKRGDEAGMFKFGGSCVATIFESGAKIDWNEELAEKSAQGIECYARVCER